MDNDIIEWLEEQLENYKGSVLMITHDRYFLERVTNHICEIEKGALVSYEGNYEAYLIARRSGWSRPKPTSGSGRTCTGRSFDGFAGPHRLEPPNPAAGYSVFRKSRRPRKPLTTLGWKSALSAPGWARKIIELKDIGKSYGGVEYIHDFSYNILRNDRIGIVGNNGCGKTTLLPDYHGAGNAGYRFRGNRETVRIGYFSQESEEMDPNLRVIKYVEKIARNVKTKDGYLSASQMLEKFLFPSYMHSVRIEKLSGGERRRLYLLAVLMRAPNVLILDEPTNDLDIDTLTVLEDYLDDFPGAVLIVSHDRYFLDRLVIRTFAFEEGGEIREYTGGYSKYMNEKEAREEALSGVKTNSAEDGAAVSRSSDGRNQRAPKLRFTYKEQKEFDTIDEDIETLEEKIGNLEREMMQNGTDSFLLADLSQQKTALEAELDEKMERWEYLHELAERIERGERTDGTVD